MHAKIMLPVLLLGCSSNPSTPSDAGTNDAAQASDAAGDGAVSPEQAFWTAFWAGDLAAGAAAVPALQAASSVQPPDWYSTLLVGMDATWQLAEIGRNPSQAQQTAQTYGPMASQYLGQAHGLNPTDAFTTALDGFTVWNAGMQTNNSQWVTQGKALVDQAYQQTPELGWFLELILAQNLPVSDPQMQTAITDGWSYFSICGNETMNQSNPDFAAYLAQAKTGTRRFCANDSLAPHMVEGSFLYFGDLLVKAGSVSAAKAVFAAAQTTPDYASWPHHDVVDARVSSDLTARSAMYQGAPSTWPPFAASPYVCGTCHNTTQ
jgi:hypothetical protein